MKRKIEYICRYRYRYRFRYIRGMSLYLLPAPSLLWILFSRMRPQIFSVFMYEYILRTYIVTSSVHIQRTSVYERKMRKERIADARNGVFSRITAYYKRWAAPHPFAPLLVRLPPALPAPRLSPLLWCVCACVRVRVREREREGERERERETAPLELSRGSISSSVKRFEPVHPCPKHTLKYWKTVKRL